MEIDFISYPNHHETQEGEELQNHQEEYEKQKQHKEECSAQAAKEDKVGAKKRKGGKEPQVGDAKRVCSKDSPLAASALGICDSGTSTSTIQATEVHNDQQINIKNSTKHDVFLNHRGPNLKATFVSHLDAALRRAGCNPFLDVKSLVKGQHAFNSINEALAGVLVHVAIFSPQYAESKYCLNELCDMLESKKPLIPVFYDVEPENLSGMEVGPFTEAFCEHLKKGRDEDVVRWKAALLEVAPKTGFRRIDFADEAKLVEKVVAVVLDYLPTPPPVALACPVVGLEEPSMQVIDMLHKMVDNVRVVGICGMGGIGKTTLARQVYNQEQSSFQNRCFLKDVKESEGDNMKNLQMKMVTELLHEDVGKRPWDFAHWRGKMGNQKVLLVIDDISKKKTFNELIPDLKQLAIGSCVLITSREQDVLKSIMRDFSQGKIYHMSKLSDLDSLDLFTWCAFRENNLHAVDVTFHNFVKEVTRACCGLPLALEVMGGLLFDKTNLPNDEIYWNEATSALRTNGEINSSLQSSYYRLVDEDCKHMFLDIACFMLNHSKEVAMEAWKSNYGTPNFSLQKLIDRCLVKVDVDGQLSMHDLVRDMGQTVVLEKASNNPEMCSHVWDPKLVAKLLRKKQILNETLMALSVNGVDPCTVYKAELYARMTELKYLSLDGCVVKGDFSEWSKELTWLQWRFFLLDELPQSLKLLNLAVLDLAGSHHLTRLWARDLKIEIHYKQLRILILSYCTKLMELPQDITKVVNLKILNINHCTSLNSLPHTFSELPNLEKLNISGCIQLQKLPPSMCGLKKLRVMLMGNTVVEQLPEDFGQLQSLMEANLPCCYSLRKLPDSFSQLSNLEKLDISSCMLLQKLPPSVSRLKKLRVLCMSDTNVEQLPEDFGQLQSLMEVDLSCCESLRKLPDSFSQLSNLEELDISSCMLLQKLPPSVSRLKKLRVLRMSDTAVEQLPEDFGQLQSLMEANLSCCQSLRKLPDSFSQLSNLEELDISSCMLLQKLPPSVSRLKKLRVLRMSHTTMEQLPEDFGQLQSLMEANLSCCESLRKLPDSFSQLSNLEKLDISSCMLLQKLPPYVFRLKKLRFLRMGDTNVEQLHEDFGQLQSLIQADLSWCRSLEKLSDSFSQSSNLEKLDISSCMLLQKLPPSVSRLKKLRVLRMGSTNVVQLPEDFGQLQSLIEADLSRCRSLKKLPDSFSQLSNLEKLDISSCILLQKLPPSVSRLKKLRVLRMGGTNVEQLPEEFGQLQSLIEANLSCC